MKEIKYKKYSKKQMLKIIQKYGADKLKEIAKYNFKNTEKILSQKEKK